MDYSMTMTVIEDLAVVSCGVSGGLAAIRKKYDAFSVLIVAWITALGGGIVRDVMLGALPPVGVSDKGMILSALVSGIAALIFHPEIANMRRSMLISDALALGLFAVSGTLKTLNYGMSSVTAIFLGMATALAGGLFRDILLNVEPAILQDKHLYALPSLVGCILTAVVHKAATWGMIGNAVSAACYGGIIVLVVGLRILSVKFNILLPGAVHRTEPHLPHSHAHARTNAHVMGWRDRKGETDSGRRRRPRGNGGDPGRNNTEQ